MVHQTMKTSTPRAARASIRISHMLGYFNHRLAAVCVFILGALAGCATAPPPSPAPQVPPARTAPTAPTALPAPAAPLDAAPLVRPRSRWLPVAWSELPGWDDDPVLQAWPALHAGCARPRPGWHELCARLLFDAPGDDHAARRWLVSHLQPFRVESLDGSPDGLITGYFEPLVEAARERSARFRIPLHGLPADLATRKPFWTRQQLDTLPAAMETLRGREIAWVEDPLDALLLQIQGSGRLRVTEPDGRVQTVRLAYAGHNDQPYRSVGRWLVEQGELRLEAASWPAIKTWALRNPRRVNEMLWVNPRVVFFREEALRDPELGPRGAMGVALTPGRSIAVDPLSVPYGALVWLDTTMPLSNAPLRRLVAAQDTGSAIVGAVRADYFWGWAGDAEAQAGRMKQPLRLWVLWPKLAPPPP